jgi:CIC family chloride channel protein
MDIIAYITEAKNRKLKMSRWERFQPTFFAPISVLGAPLAIRKPAATRLSHPALLPGEMAKPRRQRYLPRLMWSIITGFGARARVLCTRFLARLGMREDSFLILPAVMIGVITAFAAVGFHNLIHKIRDLLYESAGAGLLYSNRGLVLLIAFPALGGLLVGLVGRYLVRTQAGHGVIDVIESVVRTSGFVKPVSAIEKIFTSAVTIGTGGSGGAEGPIVQIGAAISSGVGQFFRIARYQMPILIGCGSAAGISAIFNAPIGGVIFTIEVILQEFSIRTFTPLVVASVISNVTTRAIFARLDHGSFQAIFAMPQTQLSQTAAIIDWEQVGNFAFLGLTCGLAGVTLTRLMGVFENRFKKLAPLGVFRPALGGAMVGLLGIAYVLIFGRLVLHVPKPFRFTDYPMPAFFGDGYGVIQALLSPAYYQDHPVWTVLLLLGFLCGVKILATCLSLASGGSGGIIAPSLFIGATAGGFLGMVLQQTPWFATIRPEVYALVGMGAVLAAVVHAPLASILILLELTQDYRVTVPAMLASVVATGAARLIFNDSIYTHSLRKRGIRFAAESELAALRRQSVEQIKLEPATILQPTDPAQRLLDLVAQFGAMDIVVADAEGGYRGMVVAEDVNQLLLEREAVPLMLVGEVMRSDVPLVKTTDDLASVFDLFARMQVSHLPVCLPQASGNVIGLISRATMMRKYQSGAPGQHD